DRGGKKMKLKIGGFDTRIAADEAAGFEGVGRTKPALEGQPFSPDERLGEQAHLAVEGDRLFASDLNQELERIVGGLCNSPQVMNRSDADVFEMIGGADTRQHQELGRVESARG